MTSARRPIARFPVWELVSSGVGYHLDNLGRWLLTHLPTFGAAYAAMLAPGTPRPTSRPGWRFAEEYYDQRQWLACRRGALWEAAAQYRLRIPLTLPWYNGTVVDVTLGNDNSLCLYVCGSFEPNEFAFLDQVLHPGMTFIDVGANDGYYTLFAARRVGSTGRVVAVEPSSRERVNLKRNIARNRLGNTTVVPAALGSACGVADLRLAQGVHSGHNTLGKFAHDGVLAERFQRVDLETLDKVAADLELGRVDFVKIDVEGAEASVVHGARHVLTAMRPTLLLEINDNALRAQSTSGEALLATLRSDFGYDIMTFSAVTGTLERLAGSAPLSANVVAMPAERSFQTLSAAQLGR
jgi:FkbM family methyltransferase